MRRAKTFTIYDVMEAKGVFEANSANIDSRAPNGLSIYKKQNFPKMLYHPTGAEVITTQGQPVATPFGPKMVGEQRELISRTVADAEEYKAAKAEGWNDTPAEAVAKRPSGSTVVKSPAQVDLEVAMAKIKELEEKLAEAE